VGIGTPGAACGGGPGGQGVVADPDSYVGSGAGAGAGSLPEGTSLGPVVARDDAGVVSNRVTKYSVTVGCGPPAIAELGAVGVVCWLQDAIASAASESVASGTINRGDVSDMGLLPRWLLLPRDVSHSSVQRHI